MKTTSLSALPRVVSNPISKQSPPRAEATSRAGHFETSSFEAASSKQVRGRRATQTPAQLRMRELLAPGSERLRALNPTPGPQNCPATAGAVDHFLRTGEVRAADRGDNVVTYRFQNRFTDTSVAALRDELPNDGDHMVVRGLRDPALAEAENVTPEHYFVVVNDGGRLRAVDAYNGRVSRLEDVMRGEGLERLQRTSTPFNPTPHDPLAGDFVPGLDGAL